MNPTDIARYFFAALARGDWPAATSHVDPLTIIDFRTGALAHIVAWLQFQEARKANPALSGYGSSGEVDPRMLERYADSSIRGHMGARTLRDLLPLSPREFLARHLEYSHSAPDGRLTSTLGQAHEVLGHIPHRDAFAYVIYIPLPQHPMPSHREVQATAPGNPPHVEVIPAIKRDGVWYLTLNTWLTMTHMPFDLSDLPPEAFFAPPP